MLKTYQIPRHMPHVSGNVNHQTESQDYLAEHLHLFVRR